MTAELTPKLSYSRGNPLCLDLNRNQIELTCRAYENSNGRWLIDPQFIDQLPQSPPYPCATQGFDEPNGGRAPLPRRDGSVVPDRLELNQI